MCTRNDGQRGLRALGVGRGVLAVLAGGALAAFALDGGPVHAQATDTPESPATPTLGPRPSALGPSSSDTEDPTEVRVFSKDGRVFSGLLERQTPDELVLNVGGVSTRVELSSIDRFEILEPIMERYAKLRESVGNEPDQIVRLAQWLQARDKFELALSEVQRALSIDKDHGEARRLKLLLEQQIVLKVKRGDREQEGRGPRVGGAEGRGAEGGAGSGRVADVPLLSPQQVALMKVFEVDLNDSPPPRLIVPRETVLAMLEKHAGHPLVPITKEGREALLRRGPSELLNLMFKLQAREFYGQVEVLDQPKPIAGFRDTIQRAWLMNSCATTLCHGGTEAGRLVLASRRPTSDRSVYTNLLILSRFKTSKGSGGGGVPLIDWEQPDRSVLLHMGLPRQASRWPHPPVPRGPAGTDAWKPVFRSTDDRAFTQATAWIKSMYRPRPEYPIEYTPIRPFDPPAPTPAPAPAQAPSSTPGTPATLAQPPMQGSPVGGSGGGAAGSSQPPR